MGKLNYDEIVIGKKLENTFTFKNFCFIIKTKVFL